MRQFTTIILLGIFFSALSTMPSCSALKTGINYSIPIDYSKLSEPELESKAREYYNNAMQLKDGEINEDMTNALTSYSVLQNINPESIEYSVKLGILYDKIGKDRYAKGNLSRAISLNQQNPIGYFYMGEFYYKRQLYRKALKYYTTAYEKGYDKHYDTLYKLGDIYEKYGNTRAALRYLKAAEVKNQNEKLTQKIKKIESFDAVNHEYYSEGSIKE